MAYDFQTQLVIGKQAEELLDIHFGRWYDISEVSLDVEKTDGIDRIFTARQSGDITSVEYKADTKTRATGNVYVEADIVQVNGRTTQGWARKTKSDKLIYFAIPHDVYIFDSKSITDNMSLWTEYREVKTYNAGYYSVGYLVPIKEMIEICKPKVMNI